MAQERKSLLEQNALKCFDKDFIDEALEFLRIRARGKTRTTTMSAPQGPRQNRPTTRIEDGPSTSGISCAPEASGGEEGKFRIDV